MNKIKVLALAFVATITIGIATTSYASAAEETPAPATGACASAGDCIGRGVTSAGGTGSQADVGTIIKTIVNVLLFVLGAVSVVMIIIGGMKYTLSQGDSSSLTSAKNTILYSVIGLVVAIFAYGIVNFVLTQFSSTPPADPPAGVSVNVPNGTA